MAFYSDAAEQRPIRATVPSIHRITTLRLTDPELASTYGGPIAVRGKKNSLTPEGAACRVLLDPDGGTVPPVQLRGNVQISG
jgi:putative peptide zinc metalloprotease protein